MHIIPTPDGTPAARVAALANSLRRTDGNIQFVETVAGGWGGGNWPARQGILKVAALGRSCRRPAYMPPSCYGRRYAPPTGFTRACSYSTAPRPREAQRQAYLNTIIPLAGQVAHVLSDSLGVVISFDFSAAMFADIRARGQALKAMTGAGLDLPTALTIIGLGDCRDHLTSQPTSHTSQPTTTHVCHQWHGVGG